MSAATAAPGHGDFKAQVLQAIDIVELIGQTVALKRRGRTFVGLCPFHNEKTPSFNVNPTRQFFKCFGCGAGGNAIDFVMRRDRIEFVEALKLLGTQAGIEMPSFGVSKEKSSERQVLLDANSVACAFFEKLLSHPQDGKTARDYLDQRGISAESIQRFRIGLAPNAWDGLMRSPAARKFPPQQLALAGLVKPRTSGEGFYDTFRNRLMFPIRDEAGRIIAFGGRKMPDSDDPAKYLNSPETPLYSKSRCLFGLDLARQRIVETRTVAIVEGYTDVVMAHQFGCSNVVSPLGTALTSQHVEILRRFADRIVLLFDADAAGDNAMNRVVELFLTQPIEIAIATMPEGLDPDEYLLKFGKESFDQLLADAADALTYKWRLLTRQYKSSEGDLTGQQKAVTEYLELLAAARAGGPVDSMRWGSALARVSRLTDIPVDALNRRFRSTRPAPARRTTTEGPIQKAPEANQAQPVKKSAPPLARTLAERRLLGALLGEPRRWHEVQQFVHVEDFTDEPCRRLAEVYWAHQRDEGEPVFNEFLGLLTDPVLTELAVELVDEIEGLPDLEQTLVESLRFLAEERERQERQNAIAAIRRTSDEEDEIALLQKIAENARKPDLRRVGS